MSKHIWKKVKFHWRSPYTKKGPDAEMYCIDSDIAEIDTDTNQIMVKVKVMGSKHANKAKCLIYDVTPEFEGTPPEDLSSVGIFPCVWKVDKIVRKFDDNGVESVTAYYKVVKDE